MNSPETSITEVQPTTSETGPSVQNATPLDFKKPQSETGEGGRVEGDEATTPEPRGEDGVAAQTDQEEPKPTADEAEESTHPSQSEESEANEGQRDEDQEKQAKLAAQITLLITKAILTAIETQVDDEEKKRQLKEQITALEGYILQKVEKREQITYPELGEELTKIGEAVEIPQLQILGRELQMLFAEGEKKEELRQQIATIAEGDEKLMGQLSRLYQLFTGKRFDEKESSLIDIAEGFVGALDNIDEVAERAKQLGFNSKKIKEALSVFNEQKQLIEQAVNQAKKEKKPLWKTAGALGILGILILLFTLIRSALAGEREQSPI